MSYFSHAFQKMFVVAPGKTLVTSASVGTETLTAGQIGIFNPKTFKGYGAQAVGLNYQMFLVAQGSYHTTDSLSSFLGGLQESIKSRPINPRFVEDFYKVCPRVAQNEVWAIGYNGSSNAGLSGHSGVGECNTITGKCSSKYTIRVEVGNEQILRTYNRNLYRQFTVETPCCDPCDEDCEVADVDPKWIADQLVAQINADPEISRYVVAQTILETAVAHDDDDLIEYNITVTDTENQAGIDAVEAYFAEQEAVTRIDYAGGVSTYRLVLKSSATAPTAGLDIGGGELIVSATATGEFKPVRNLCVTLAHVTGVNNLTDFTTFLGTLDGIVAGNIDLSAGTSADVITFKQYANAYVTETDDTAEAGTFDSLQSYSQFDADGNIVNVVTIGECPCPVTAVTYTDSVGIKLTAGFTDTTFGDCSFSPRDAYNLQPIRVQVSLLDDAALCAADHSTWAVTQLQVGSQASGLGETILRQYQLSLNYKQEPYEYDPRWREVMDRDPLGVVDRTKYYVLYYLTHYIPNSLVKSMNITSYDERYVLCFAFEETDTTAMTNFEALFTGAGGLLAHSSLSVAPSVGVGTIKTYSC